MNESKKVEIEDIQRGNLTETVANRDQGNLLPHEAKGPPAGAPFNTQVFYNKSLRNRYERTIPLEEKGTRKAKIYKMLVQGQCQHELTGQMGGVSRIHI